MTPQDLKDWDTLRQQFINGWHLSESDWRELTRLNHLVMEASHDIHNSNMLRKEPTDWQKAREEYTKHHYRKVQ